MPEERLSVGGQAARRPRGRARDHLTASPAPLHQWAPTKFDPALPLMLIWLDGHIAGPWPAGGSVRLCPGATGMLTPNAGRRLVVEAKGTIAHGRRRSASAAVGSRAPLPARQPCVENGDVIDVPNPARRDIGPPPLEGSRPTPFGKGAGRDIQQPPSWQTTRKRWKRRAF